MDTPSQRHPNEPPADVPAASAEAKAKSKGQKKKTSSTPSPAANSSKPIQRRRRQILSCMQCRSSKLGCDHKAPCFQCIKKQRACHYFPPDEEGQILLAYYKANAGRNEMTLENQIAKRLSVGLDGDSNSDDVSEGAGGENDLQITPMVALDLTYDNYSDGNDLIDLGVRVGRMRITERIGGMNRPRISEEIRAGISDVQRVLPESSLDIGYELPDAPGSELPDFLKPGESYLAPASGFFFGQIGEPIPFLQLLPSRKLGDDLIQRYFSAIHPIARCVHRPSFESMYRSFWEDIELDITPRPSTQAVIFAAWFSAAVSIDEVFARQYGCTKAQLVTSTKIGIETALGNAGFLYTTRFETLQGFVMYLLPLCRDEVSRGHSVLVGAAVRMAECMGLDRDGSTYGLKPLETEIRRLVWHQLCFLDIRTCEAQGPKPAIRREDYDTQLPTNCEEEDLTADSTVAPTPATRWTPMLFSIMRFEINEMMRTIWADRRKLEMHKTTLTAMLAKIEHFRKTMYEKYHRLFDDSEPIQKYAFLVMDLLLYRLHAMVLHPFHANTTNPLPDKLNGLLVLSGITIIGTAIKLESGAMFRDWTWYLGAYQQYQIALLLATEVYYRPNAREAQKIWPCLDWVFNLDPNQPRAEKSVKILAEIMAKTNFYMGLRKARAPTATSQAVPDKQAVKKASPPPLQPTLQPLGPPIHPSPPMGRPTPMPPPPPQFQWPPPPIQPPPPTQQQQQQQLLPARAGGPSGPNMGPSLALPPPMPMPSMPPPLPPMPPLPPQQQRMPSLPMQQLPLPHEFNPAMVFSGGMGNGGEGLYNSPGTSSDGGGSAVGGGGGGQQLQQQPPPQQQQFGGMAGGPGMGAAPGLEGPVAVDWAVINALFPEDPDTGRLGFIPYADSAMDSLAGMGPGPGMGMGAGMGLPPTSMGLPSGMDAGMGPLSMEWQDQHP